MQLPGCVSAMAISIYTIRHTSLYTSQRMLLTIMKRGIRCGLGRTNYRQTLTLSRAGDWRRIRNCEMCVRTRNIHTLHIWKWNNRKTKSRLQFVCGILMKKHICKISNEKKICWYGGEHENNTQGLRKLQHQTFIVGVLNYVMLILTETVPF